MIYSPVCQIEEVVKKALLEVLTLIPSLSATTLK